MKIFYLQTCAIILLLLLCITRRECIKNNIKLHYHLTITGNAIFTPSKIWGGLFH